MVRVHNGKWWRAAMFGAVLVVSGCASVPQPLRSDLDAENVQVQQCAHLFETLDAVVARAGVGDAQARPVSGFPYLRVDRFTAALASSADHDSRAFDSWVERMQALGEQGRRVEISNLPETDIVHLGASDRQAVVSHMLECARTMAQNDLANEDKARELLDQRAHVPDDYSSFERAVGLYALTSIPFSSGIKDWHEEATAAFKRARSAEDKPQAVLRYVPPEAATYTRDQVAALLKRSADPLGVPVLSAGERERLFATYAPVFEMETSGHYDHIGRLFWTGSVAPQVDISHPTVYRKLAYTLDRGQVLLQLVYVVWVPERPQQSAFDLYSGKLDGIVWRVTLAPDGEPLLFDSIHPCGCFQMYFPTPRAEPLPAPHGDVEWAFIPATLPAIPEGDRITVSAQTRTHYLDNVWPHHGQTGIEYAFADYDSLRTLELPGGGSRSIFGPDGLVPGTQRDERFFFWPMGIASAGAMRQWGTQATAFVGRSHFDDADLIERRFRLIY